MNENKDSLNLNSLRTYNQVNKRIQIWAAFRAAFPHTVPILAGFVFLGIAYGIYMNSLGFSAIYPIIMSFAIFAGSMEFVAANFLLVAFNPMNALFLTLMVNARHLFYGISMLDKYRGTGKKKLYLIYGMCDESFSINCTVDIPKNVDKGWFMFFVTLLNHSYWVIGAAIGGIFGSLVKFNTEGLDFVMTALFVVIFIEQWIKEKRHFSNLAGLGLSAVSLMIFGGSNFIIPAMLAILGTLTAFRKPLEKVEVAR
ncbi:MULTISPECIES: azaleucine resistance protein AzlC [Bacillus]|uniref:azaleucine resistance protein AzlC n=1 Tax=Bacillus paralicheniformis TaxID=1648923 RepID=UPI000D991B0B|nr:azaleucine resistance protein AzlC [Bacillus paralicheniformis]MED1221387.1 azaleucine resistance protein AzlC [Bacillus paralicheniformis]QSF99560.1 azaleucine resistance protein AzlC [Bacillus paralicheniformis]WMW45998.1 azaleucine resistance protein AzlC [Bacillus paralicheniformis]